MNQNWIKHKNKERTGIAQGDKAFLYGSMGVWIHGYFTDLSSYIFNP